MAESHSRTELRRLADEFEGLAGHWRRQRASCVGQLQQAFAHFGVGPQSETADRYERASRQAWLLLPPDARAECDGWPAFVEKWTGKHLPRSLPDVSEATADAILCYLCGAPTDQAPVGGGQGQGQTTVKSKKGTVANEAREKIIAALTLHHDFDGDSCMNMDFATGVELAQKAGVDRGTVSRFFKKAFGGYEAYRGICTRGNTGRLIAELQKLRDEELSRLGFGDEPINHPGHRRRSAGNRDRD